MKVKANGIDINYTIEGEGPVVTFSHSLACHLGMWDEQARALKDRFRVLRFDTRGHGQTSAPAGAYSLDQMADDLFGLLGALGIKETHFVGLSMGGMIGQVFALSHPAMVQSLVLCDTTSRYPAAAAPIWEDRIRTVEAKGMEPLVGPTLERWFTAPFRTRRPDLMQEVGAMIRNTPRAGLHRLLPRDPEDRRHRPARRGPLPRARHRGRGGSGTPVEMSRQIHAALPSAELAILRSASHLSNLEQPAEFTRVLSAFLDKAAGRTRL